MDFFLSSSVEGFLWTSYFKKTFHKCNTFNNNHADGSSSSWHLQHKMDWCNYVVMWLSFDSWLNDLFLPYVIITIIIGLSNHLKLLIYKWSCSSLPNYTASLSIHQAQGSDPQYEGLGSVLPPTFGTTINRVVGMKNDACYNSIIL